MNMNVKPASIAWRACRRSTRSRCGIARSAAAPDLRILISQSSFRLKGSGWYVTDFRDPRPDPGKQKKQEKDTAAGEAAASKSEGQGKSQGKEQGSDKSASGDSAKGAAPQKAGKPPKGDKAS